jgi:Ribbon-helix-helix protein, copG family
MHSAQVILEDWQHDALEDLAKRTGKSISDLLRDILSEHLRGSTERRGLKKIEGIGADPEATGEAHDRFLYGGKAG